MAEGGPPMCPRIVGRVRAGAMHSRQICKKGLRAFKAAVVTEKVAWP